MPSRRGGGFDATLSFRLAIALSLLVTISTADFAAGLDPIVRSVKNTTGANWTLQQTVFMALNDGIYGPIPYRPCVVVILPSLLSIAEARLPWRRLTWFIF